MNYSKITSQIADLPHVTSVKWHDGCMFIFVDFVPSEAKYDPAPYPILDKAVGKALSTVSDNEAPYRSRGYVDPEGRLFGVLLRSDTSLESVHASLAAAIAA